MDDIIREVFEYLETYDLLDNTYVLYTSDHGYHLGQWRIACSKQQMYDTDIRIPMFIRGPGIAPQSSRDEMIVNIDILPTFVDLAGIVLENASIIDGKSLVGAIIPPFEENTNILIENQIENSRNFQKHRKTEMETETETQTENGGNKYIVDIDIDIKQKEKDLLKMREILRVNSTYSWRQMMISQYHTGESLTFSHCTVWWINHTIPMQIGGTIPNETIFNAMEIGNNGNIKDTPGFPGVLRNPPNGNAEGVEWKVNSKSGNNWRAIRILNSTHNWSYGEFIDREWNDTSKANPWFYELYDLNSDYYQMTNLYPIWSQNASMQGVLNELHSMLMQMGECSGANCFQ